SVEVLATGRTPADHVTAAVEEAGTAAAEAHVELHVEPGRPGQTVSVFGREQAAARGTAEPDLTTEAAADLIVATEVLRVGRRSGEHNAHEQSCRQTDAFHRYLHLVAVAPQRQEEQAPCRRPIALLQRWAVRMRHTVRNRAPHYWKVRPRDAPGSCR